MGEKFKARQVGSKQMFDLQETRECGIPKEAETASPSQHSLCEASVSAERLFQRL